jgi:hypothetical protein
MSISNLFDKNEYELFSKKETIIHDGIGGGVFTKNINPAGVASGINVYDQLDNVVFQAGYNNADDISYVFATKNKSLRFGLTNPSNNSVEFFRLVANQLSITYAIPMNIISPGYDLKKWAVAGTSNTTVTGLTFTPTVAGTYTLSTMSQGYATATTGSISIRRTTRFKFDGVTITAGGDLELIQNNDGILTLSTQTYLISGATINVRLFTETGQSVAWSGVTTITY